MTSAYGTVGNDTYINPFSPTGQGAAPSVTYGAVNTPAVPTTLNSGNLKSSSPVTLPPPPLDTTNYAGILANGNAQAQAIQAGIDALTAAKTPPVTPPPTTPTDTSTQDASIYQKILAMIKPPEAPASVSGSYASAEQNAGISGLQANVNTNHAAVLAAQGKLAAANAKLAGINGEATAQNLGLQNEGAKITTTGVSTASNQNIRDAAIRAIPIQVEVMGAQAEIAAAQGNEQLSQNILSQAQDHLDKSFQLQQKDVENKYKYQVDMYNAALDVADKAETRRLEAKKAEATQAFTTQQNNLNNAQSIAATALASGQATVASKITQLDPKSPTFLSDLARLQAQIVPKAPKATASEIDQATVNSVTNQLTKAKGGDGYTDPNLYARLRSSASISATDFDNRFGYLVNPASRQRLGLSTASPNVSGEQIKKTVYQQMITPAWSKGTDAQKRAYVLSLGGNPADYGL